MLDVDCRAHELDNLYVVDTSVFPSIGAVNPALTAMANSLRVGDHLLERLGSSTVAGQPVVTDVTAEPLLGEQIELAFGDQRVVVVEVGGGLRTYSVDGVELLDGYGPSEMRLSGRGQMLMRRGRTGSRTGATSSTAAATSCRSTSLRTRNAIHGLVRWAAWTVVEREPHRAVMEHVLHPQPGYPFSLALSVEYALAQRRADGAHDRDQRRRRRLPVRRAALTRTSRSATDRSTRSRSAYRPRRCSDRTSAACPPGRSPSRAPTSTSASRGRSAATRLDNAFTDLQDGDDGRVRVELRDPDGGAGVTVWVGRELPVR